MPAMEKPERGEPESAGVLDDEERRVTVEPVKTSEQNSQESGGRDRDHRAPTIRCYRASRWLLLGGWVLIMPPVPMGTALPPISQWSQVSAHKTASECDVAREAMRKSANRTVTNDPNASALKVAAALGQLQAKCIQSGPDQPPQAPPAAQAPEAPQAPKPPAKR